MTRYHEIKLPCLECANCGGSYAFHLWLNSLTGTPPWKCPRCDWEYVSYKPILFKLERKAPPRVIIEVMPNNETLLPR